MEEQLEALAQKAGVTFFDYQLSFLEEVPSLPSPLRACLYYKTGAGKSLTALAALALLEHSACVVICPPSTHNQWTALGDKLGVAVTPMSHAKFRMPETKLSRTVPVIADEFHLFGGQKGKGWRKLDTMARHLDAPLILASATPNYNDAERCYCVQHILDPHGTKGGYLQFLYQYCITEQNPFGMEPRVLGFHQYPDAAVFLADMPKVFYLADDQQYTINDLKYPVDLPDELVTFGYNRRRHRMVASQMEMRHTVRYQGLVDKDGYLRPEVSDLLADVIKETPVMIYTSHATIALAVSRSLKAANQTHILVTGSMSKPMKDAALARFLTGSVPVLIGTSTLSTGTDGIDKMCDTLVILDDTDDDALRRQLIGRVLPRGDSDSSTTKQIVRFIPAS